MRVKDHLLSWLAVILITIGLMPMKTDAESALPYLELTRPDRGKVFAVAWSPDGQYVAVGTEQGVWLYTDTFADVLYTTDKPIHALAWSPDGQVIATGYFDKWFHTKEPRSNASNQISYLVQSGGLRLWAVQRTDQRLTLAPRATLLREGSVHALRFSPDGNSLASLSVSWYPGFDVASYDVGAAQDVLRIHAVTTGKLLQQFDSWTSLLQDETITQSANGLAWSHDGRYLATIDTFGKGQGRYFSVWDTVREQFAVTPGLDACKPGTGSITGVDWSDGDAQVAFSSVYWGPGGEGGIRVGYWGNRQAACQDPLLGESQDGHSSGDIFALAWRPGSQWLAYTEGTTIQLWDAATKLPIAQLDAARYHVTMLAWNADGSKLLAAGSDYAVRLWTRFDSYALSDPRPVREIPLGPGYSNALSRDGRWKVAVNQTSGHVEVLDAVNGSVRYAFDTHVDQLRTRPVDFEWSPDSSALAISIYPPDDHILHCDELSQHAVQLWSVQTGKMIFSRDGVTSLAWRPDSRAVAVGIMKLYRIPSVEPGELSPVEVGSFEVRDTQTGQVVEEAPPSEQWGEVLRTSRYADADESDTFYLEHLLSVSRWSPDGRLLAIHDEVVCGVWGTTSVILWDTKAHRIATQLDVWRRDAFGGSGDFAVVLAWSPDGNFVLVEGINQVFLYRLHRQGDKVTPELIWRRLGGYNPGNIPFSPDSRYFLYNYTVWDTGSGWPVFRFHGPMDYDTYEWVGDTLTGYSFGSAEGNEPGKAVSWRVSDFLPKLGLQR